MRNVLLAIIAAGAAFFVYKKFQTAKDPDDNNYNPDDIQTEKLFEVVIKTETVNGLGRTLDSFIRGVGNIVEGANRVKPNTPHTVIATASKGYGFVGWKDNTTGAFISTNRKYEFSMPNRDVLLTAVFSTVTVDETPIKIAPPAGKDPVQDIYDSVYSPNDSISEINQQEEQALIKESSTKQAMLIEEKQAMLIEEQKLLESDWPQTVDYNDGAKW